MNKLSLKLSENNVGCYVNTDLKNINREQTQEIKKLLNWLRFSWNENYLKPHKNKQGFFTASNVQVRSPINNKSVGGWG